MKRLLFGGWFACLFLVLACLPACDSNGNGGGGADGAYTQAMLTGNWKYKRGVVGSPGVAAAGEMEFDSAGHFLRFILTFPVRLKGNLTNARGNLTVYPDGRVEGTITNILYFAPNGVATFKSVYRLHFNADGTISGKRIRTVVEKVGGVIIATHTQTEKYWLTKQ